MWCVLSETEELLRAFPAGKRGWDLAVEWARRQGGELDVRFLAHVGPGWKSIAG